MSEPRPVTPDTLRRTLSGKPGTALNVDAARIGNTGIFSARERGAHFIAPPPEPDETHRQLVLEAIEQMFIANAESLHLDPSSESFRLTLGMPGGAATELGILPLPVGRIMVETIRKEATLSASDVPGCGKFYDGLMRVEYRNAERRLRVHLIPTAHGAMASLKLVPTLAASAAPELTAMGFTEAQAASVDQAFAESGILIIGGPETEHRVSTCHFLMARAASAGRRPVSIARGAGSDYSGLARVEIGFDDAQQARAIVKLADAGFGCLAIEQPGPETARAAATVTLEQKAIVLVNIPSRSAPEAASQFLLLDLAPKLAATVTLATCQIQLPLLCPGCARWGEVSREDLRFFEMNATNQMNFNVRNSCQKCNGQITDFASIFEVLAIPQGFQSTLRSAKESAAALQDLLSTPGYVPLLTMVANACREGRCAVNEARQYYSWQLPPIPG